MDARNETFIPRVPVRHPPTPYRLTLQTYVLATLSFFLGRVLAYRLLFRRQFGRGARKAIRSARIRAPNLVRANPLVECAFLFGYADTLFSLGRYGNPLHRTAAIFASAASQRHLAQGMLDCTPDDLRRFYRLMQALTLNERSWRSTVSACNAVARTALALRQTGFEAHFATLEEDVRLAVDLMAKLPSMDYGLCIQVKGRRDYDDLRFYKGARPQMAAVIREEYDAFMQGVQAINAYEKTTHEPVFLQIGLSGTKPWEVAADQELVRKLRFLFY